MLTAAFFGLVPEADDLTAKINEFIRGHATFALIGNPGSCSAISRRFYFSNFGLQFFCFPIQILTSTSCILFFTVQTIFKPFSDYPLPIVNNPSPFRPFPLT
jgi:hypothetical protein